MRRFGLALALAVIASIAMPSHADATGVTRTWSVGIEPFGVTVDPRDGKIYVASSNHNNFQNFPEPLYIVDPAGPPPDPVFGPPTIVLPAPQTMSVLDAALGRLFAPLSNGSLAIVDPATRSVINVVPNAGRLGVALDAATHHVYASTLNGVVMTDGVTGNILATHSAPAVDQWWAVAHDPVRHRVFVTNLNFSAPSVVVLDDSTLAVVGNVRLPATPRLALTVDTSRGLVYAGGYFGPVGAPGSIYAIDEVSLAIVGTLDVGGGTAGVFSTTLDAATNTLYVSTLAGPNAPGNALVLVDTATFTVRTRIPLPFEPGQSAVHPDGRLYVSGLDANVLAQITINTPPSVTVSLDSSSPRTNDVLAATAVGTDPEGDTLTYTFTWTVNGAVARTTTTPSPSDSLDLAVAGNGDRGDVISVSVVASDGQATSAAASASATVANSAPSVTASLNTSSPRTNDVLTATAASADPDDDSLAYAFTWTVNGSVARTTTTTSPSDSFDLAVAGHGDAGDVVSVSVVASDGQGASAAASASATVANSAPTVAVSFDDASPWKRALVTATVTSADPDSDTLSYAYTWTLNGVTVRSVTTTAASDAYDLRAVDAQYGDVLRVDVVASDGAASASASTSGKISIKKQ